MTAALPSGSELKLVPVAPCRMLDTRVVGGVVSNAARNFSAVGGLGAQGGASGGCGIPSYAKALALNVGAISSGGSAGYVKGYSYGSAVPAASLVNFDKSGAVANMVTLKIRAGNPSFVLRTGGSAHLFADVAGYYVSSPYVAVASNGAVYQSIASGVVGIARTGVGMYTVTFDRDVTGCGAATNSITWATNNDPSASVGAGGANQVVVGVTDQAGAMVDSYFTLALSC
ncbi:hypothetical protein BA895_18410 [Humibacillus sp. DSM 29435]|nr:hypothetical protein BA895_18410 [Humibacillus sp. DSM 29435]